MNCPKPGGNVRVVTSRVTSAGYTRRLTGRDGLRGTGTRRDPREKETLRSLPCGVGPEECAHPRMANAGSS
ncbi:hypothetical protein EYF80_051772 [Liparis tanakae]|uniref:Uncharacterized protein n=1 Tax=Liparis tanakae TaxID=230148 RepID=A0A4Z2FA76_9TELE|nr:hypothetical protein EYF80_051772 [Liparis tanakae]